MEDTNAEVRADLEAQNKHLQEAGMHLKECQSALQEAVDKLNEMIKLIAELPNNSDALEARDIFAQVSKASPEDAWRMGQEFGEMLRKRKEQQ